jgi:hypothetical protein
MYQENVQLMTFFLHYSRIRVLTRKFRKPSNRILNGIEKDFELVLTASDMSYSFQESI